LSGPRVHGSDTGFALIYTAVILPLILPFGGLATDSLRAYLV
jgi:hypothetical protein